MNIQSVGRNTVYCLGALLVGWLVLWPAAQANAELTCSKTPLLMKRFLRNHYAAKSMTAEIRAHAVDQMINNLDPSRTLLYESDVDWLRPVLADLFNGIASGNCALTRPVHDLIVARARENEAMVKRYLSAPYQPDKNAELLSDVKKRPYTKKVSEKITLLKTIVQFQIENDLLAKIPPAEAVRRQIHHYELQTKRAAGRTPEKLITSAAESFAAALDPHTAYLSPDNFSDIKIYSQLALEGIGAVLINDNGFTVIEELTPGGGAERSGVLKPKDKIIAVAQENTRPVNVVDMELRDVVKMIRGKKGTRVTLTILRQEERVSRFDVTIVRDQVSLKDQEAKLSYDTRTAGGGKYRIAIIELPSFYGDEKQTKSCYLDVKRLLREAMLNRVDGVVLDLSRNGGGLLPEAIQLVSLFIGPGNVVATRDNEGRVTVLASGDVVQKGQNKKRKVVNLPAPDPRDVYHGPLVVLTSRMSASASEIVAGVLKDYRRAVIVGTDHTFGKGSVQHLTALPLGLGGMKVTTAMYFLPGGRSTQKAGVESDIRLPNWSFLEDYGEKGLDYSLPAQAIIPFAGNLPSWSSVSPELIAELAVRSRTRIAKDNAFAEMSRKNREASARKGLIRISDLRKEKKNKAGSMAEARKESREQFEPLRKESVNVLCDMISAAKVKNIAAVQP